MRLSDFEPEVLSFQVDYPFANWLWDRAGQVWERLAAAFPGIEVTVAAPGNIGGVHDRFEFAVEIKKAFLLLHRPVADEVESFGRVCRAFVESVATTLDIQQLDRVGHRVAFTRSYPTLPDATRDLSNLNLVTVPTSANFGLKDPKTWSLEYAATQRGQSTGTTVRIKSDERKVELKPPPSMGEVPPQEWKTPRIAVDCDFFTCAPLLKSQFDANAWVTSAGRVMRRDIKRFLGDA